MSQLLDRMSWSETNVYPVLNKAGTNDIPMTIPLTRIQILPGMISVEDMQPLITSDGAPVAATSNGSWGQLYRAGRR